jgi:hypothetical protein
MNIAQGGLLPSGNVIQPAIRFDNSDDTLLQHTVMPILHDIR